MNDVIFEFLGENRYLSNFYLCNFRCNETTWKHVEGAFQAAKTTYLEDYNKFIDLSPTQAKQLGRKIKIRNDWEQVKVEIMHQIVLAKFYQNKELSNLLIKTGDVILEEGNTWNDRFWGISPPGSGKGLNMLGEIPMNVRKQLIHPTEGI